ARDDADLVDGVGAFAVGSNEGVADLVIRHAALFLFAQTPAFALGTSNDFFDGVFQILLLNILSVAASGKQGGLVDGIGEVSAGEAGSGLRDAAQIHSARERVA